MPGASRRTFLSSPLSLALAAMILFSLARPLDAFCCHALADLLGLAPAEAASGEFAVPLLNTAMYIIYAAGGFVCARFVQGRARLIATVQLIALTAFLFIPFYHILVPALAPVSYLSSALLGFSLGTLQRSLNEALERLQIQQVESTLRSRQLTETRLQLVKQDEVERKMLAADLHDQVLNDLKLLLRMIDREKAKLGAELLAGLTSGLDLAMNSIRKVMESLCPSDLEHIGLMAALEDCLKERADKFDFLAQFRCSFQEEDIKALNKIEKALLYRLVQESITNICKHARASRVRLTADIADEELIIKIVDDGVGIQPAAANSASRGLQYMRLRSEIVGARITWNPGPENKGTSVEVRMNLRGRVASESSDS
jgi:signal transduction histidine kinase